MTTHWMNIKVIASKPKHRQYVSWMNMAVIKPDQNTENNVD